MKISQEDGIMMIKISICQSIMVYEDCWVNFPTTSTRVGNLEVCWRESARRVQLSGNQTVVDRVRRVAVEDFVLSQEASQKSTDQLVRFRMKLPFFLQMCTR